ncbi:MULTISPECIES: hypothetical protein [unclassified Salinibacterium]|uniref:hypothetical protein n=1 Tax=Salinibacterium sp. GXW1014 TaxID=3377838 RepID=UPI0019E25AE1|nr:hypothetical protein [Salinibacterium sp.]MBF0671757.1 hypothetical protein [Salinibacterium sp.]
MKRIDYYGRSFTVSDRFADGFIGYVNHLVASGKPFGEFFTVRCYINSTDGVMDVSVQLVSGVPVLVYPASPEFDGMPEPEDEPQVLSRLAKREWA